MNLPVAELDDKVLESAMRRFREARTLSGSSTVVSDGSSSMIDANMALRDGWCGEKEAKANS